MSKADPSSHWIETLVRTVQECRSENTDQRFGQLLFNIIAIYDRENSPRYDGLTYDEDFHRRLFYIEDQELVKIIKQYKEGKLL